jgi:hypothetical protein
MQGIYTYIPETNHIPKEYNVAAIINIIVIIIIIIIIIILFTYACTNLNFRDFSLFNVGFKRRNCPSAWCASATNAIDSDTCIFNGSSVSVNTIG